MGGGPLAQMVRKSLDREELFELRLEACEEQGEGHAKWRNWQVQRP